MKLRNPFGKADKEKHGSPRMSPMLQAMAAEISRWPPSSRPIMERIVSEAAADGVSSMDQFFAFLEAHPDLKAGYYRAMSGL